LSADAPRVAIVIPCYNDGATLNETLESIDRDPSPIELVVVDDGSTDPLTIGVLGRLARNGVKVIHQSNEGLSAAGMTGIRATTADYVMRFDADDLLEPGVLALLADSLDNAPEAAAAWGDIQTFGVTDFRVPSVPELDPWLVTYVNCIPGSGTLIRRSALEEAGGWQLREGFEDWDIWMSFAELGYSGVYVPRVSLRYRRDGGGTLASWLPDTTEYYGDLRRRHERLFAMRRENGRRSMAPPALKLVVCAIDALPRVRRLTKIQLCQLFTLLFWNGGVRVTVTMMKQAVSLRLRGCFHGRRG
jgi:glycosyltransferase involved in cell wall biosynthesis